MSSNAPIPGDLKLRYGSADVFERADTRAKVIAQLARDDPFEVLGTDAEFYQVQLADGTPGFIYAHNVSGTNMPLTVNEQHDADDRAERAARPPQGWRGLLHRLGGKGR